MGAPTWLEAVAWVLLAGGVVSAAAIGADVARGYRQHMAIMELVWPITGLYAGPLAVLAYARWGRPKSMRWQHEHGVDGPPEKPFWASVLTGVSHCGAGCTLGDGVAIVAVFALGLSVAGQEIFAEWIASFVLALAAGIWFQYRAIAPMQGLGVKDGLVAAAKADVLSLTAFEVGMIAWMALVHFVLVPGWDLRPDSPVYWASMQVAMLIGFATAWPANVLLIRRGIKEAM
ncbi:DUF4396 domain-containing protein [Nocardioides bruguierae]|uniref:DUF4396 domain-containing protein n=1 Tax=Nocardioides bruguierae TaxID=2945102 RepID=A0A9X2D5Z3_9ACTN|nr:DUF4396 domain-containing protein [Nocardioides bruguierae]MCM0619472.1 DUF4396 domain-containing protein [Nocardioides bruguierae]